MGFPVSRVGNLVRVGGTVGKIITGASAHTVDGASGGSVGTISNGLVMIFDQNEINAIENDDSGPGASNPENPTGDDQVVGNIEPDDTPPTFGSTSCSGISGSVTSSYELAPGFTLGMFTDGRNSSRGQPCAGKHAIKPQHGLSKAQIACHLKTVTNRCLVPIAHRFGRNSFTINSGFRHGNGASQHQKGMAADIQFPGKSQSEVIAIAQWCAANLDFDQLIFEKANGYWIHISYDPNKSRQRKQIMSCNTNNGRYISGLVRL